MNFGVCVPVNKVLGLFFSIINLRCMNFFFFDLVVNCSSILVVRLAHSADLRSRQHGVLMHQLLFLLEVTCALAPGPWRSTRL